MKTKIEKDSVYNTPQQLEVKERLGYLFESNTGTTAEKLGQFAKFISRQDLSMLVGRYEVFKQVLDVKGSIVECGVYYGNGLMTWAKLSGALEPLNYNRRVLGFDTFEGNKSFSERDTACRTSQGVQQPEYSVDSEEELRQCIGVYDANRFLDHIPKIELVRGDITITVPQYIKDNPHLLVSLLSLSGNLYEPTRTALRNFLPRMPKGAIIAIHTLNEGVFPGATGALLEEFNIRNSSIRSFSFAPNLSYIVM